MSLSGFAVGSGILTTDFLLDLRLHGSDNVGRAQPYEDSPGLTVFYGLLSKESMDRTRNPGLGLQASGLPTTPECLQDAIGDLILTLLLMPRSCCAHTTIGSRRRLKDLFATLDSYVMHVSPLHAHGRPMNNMSTNSVEPVSIGERFGRVIDLGSKSHKIESHWSNRVVSLGKILDPLLNTGSTQEDRKTPRHG